MICYFTIDQRFDPNFAVFFIEFKKNTIPITIESKIIRIGVLIAVFLNTIVINLTYNMLFY